MVTVNTAHQQYDMLLERLQQVESEIRVLRTWEAQHAQNAHVDHAAPTLVAEAT